MPRLTESERLDFLQRNPAWQPNGDQTAVTRDFKFKDFAAAWAFMTRVAAIAEHMDHHPDWSNSYNRVSIALTTHDSGGLTANDTRLAQAIDAEAAE